MGMHLSQIHCSVKKKGFGMKMWTTVPKWTHMEPVIFESKIFMDDSPYTREYYYITVQVL